MSSRFALHPVAMAAAALLSLASGGVLAQGAPARVEITGSSIKRLDLETALPVQVIRREDIDATGVTTVAELLKTLSANTAPLADGASITDGTSGQRGFNGANLRGLGVSSTLVLLNGRRLANFASPGDNAGVDLNNVPAGAIDRVEVLKDGASAIYGTDAIGGVINFITRRDYRGLDLSAYASGTSEGGAGKRTMSLSVGAGDPTEDGFNVLGVLDLQQLDALRSSQRRFIQERPLAELLPALMSSRPFPANIRLRSEAQWNALQAAGLVPAGDAYRRNVIVNPSAPGCNPPASVYAPDSYGGPYGCSYDYMRDTEIYPESERIGLLGRASLRLNADHQVFAELLHSRTSSLYRLSPNPQAFSSFPVAQLPQVWRDALSQPGVPATVNRIQLRMSEAGNRTHEVTSEARRLVLGASGLFGDWDYDLAYARAENTAVDRYVDGYVLFDRFDAALRDGTVNAFGPSGDAGRALIGSIKVDDPARSSRGVTDAIDAKASRGLWAMGGGEAAIALGAEYRRERTRFDPSALLLSNNIAGDRGGSGAADLAATRDERSVASAYTELALPLAKGVDAQLAARYDRYSAVDDTFNPKAGLRWQPSKAVLVRASAGTGFRAPSLSDLHRPTTYGTASSFLTDPQCVAEGYTIDECTDQWPVERRSNPNLKPEKSRQFSLGMVFEPTASVTLSVDYFDIRIKDVISTLGEQVIVESPEKYNGRYIVRDADGIIETLILQKENQGQLQTSGLDLGANWRGRPGPYGRFGASLQGTWVLQYDRQFGPLEPMRSNLGVFLNDQVIQRWRHRVALDWDFGAFGLTLANQYSSGYTDQNTTYDPVSNELLPARRVKAYSLWDLTGSWSVNRQFKLRAGILNLANTAPPFSNQAYYFLAGYDPTHTDPRGRSLYVSVNYKFR